MAGAEESGPDVRGAAGLIEGRSATVGFVDGRGEDSGPALAGDGESAIGVEVAELDALDAESFAESFVEPALGLTLALALGGEGATLVVVLSLGAVDAATPPGSGGGCETFTRGGAGECEGGEGASVLELDVALGGRGGSGAFGAAGDEPFICAVSSAPRRASESARMSLPSSSAASAPR